MRIMASILSLGVCWRIGSACLFTVALSGVGAVPAPRNPAIAGNTLSLVEALAPKGGGMVAKKAVLIAVGEAKDAWFLFDVDGLAWRAGFDGAVAVSTSPSSGVFRLPGGAHYFFKNLKSSGIEIHGAGAPREGPAISSAKKAYFGGVQVGARTLVRYSIGEIDVIESPDFELVDGVRAISRTFSVGEAKSVLEIVAAEQAITPVEKDGMISKSDIHIYIVEAPAGVELISTNGRSVVRLPQNTPPSRFKVLYTEGAIDATVAAPSVDLQELLTEAAGQPTNRVEAK